MALYFLERFFTNSTGFYRCAWFKNLYGRYLKPVAFFEKPNRSHCPPPPQRFSQVQIESHGGNYVLPSPVILPPLCLPAQMKPIRLNPLETGPARPGCRVDSQKLVVWVGE